MAPCLAESWKESADGLTYEFKLREGLRFHNGDPFTAEDVKFSFHRYRGTAAKLLHERVKAVEIVDPHRVRFVLHAPWPDFLVFYATPATGAAWVVPKKYIENVGEEGFKKQIQKLMHERVMHAPIFEPATLHGVGPRVEEPAVGLNPLPYFAAPYEDMRLKKP